MAQTSFPWENVDTSETQFSQMFRTLNDGVNGLPTGTELGVTPAFAGLAVVVAPGQAMVRGHFYINTLDEELNLAVANPTNPRIDTVVLRLDPETNNILLAVLTGTPAASPTAPALTQTDAGVYEKALADILVPPTAGIPGTITDRRNFMGEKVGSWTTAGRPDTNGRATFGYNTTREIVEYYNGSTWQAVASVPGYEQTFLLMGV